MFSLADVSEIIQGTIMMIKNQNWMNPFYLLLHQKLIMHKNQEFYETCKGSFSYAVSLLFHEENYTFLQIYNNHLNDSSCISLFYELVGVPGVPQGHVQIYKDLHKGINLSMQMICKVKFYVLCLIMSCSLQDG